MKQGLPSRHVRYRGADRACGERVRQAQVRCREEYTFLSAIPLSDIRVGGILFTIVRSRKTKWAEKFLLEKSAIAASRRPLDDHAEEDVTSIAVLELRAWRKIKGVPSNETNDTIGSEVLRPMGTPFGFRGVVVNARRMGQEISNRDPNGLAGGRTGRTATCHHPVEPCPAPQAA